MDKNYKFDTLQVHAGQVVDKETNARAVPIYQTTAYMFDSSDHGEDLFALKAAGNIYTRLNNPTTDVLEKRIAALEGGVGALAVASGMAAITYAIMNIAYNGDHIVAANAIYGGTYNLFEHTFPKYGISTTFVNPDDFEGYEKAITDKTKAIFIESLGNPNSNVYDIERIAKIAHAHNIPLIIDNTFGTPYLIRPIEFGADIVIHSATKFICGHGTSLGGIVVDSGKFDWKKAGKFEMLVKPDDSYHGLSYTEAFQGAAYIAKMRVQLLRDMGAAISPFNAFLLIQGCETLSLRLQKHVDNAKKIAEYLSKHPKVSKVNYSSLDGNQYQELAKKYFPKGAGSIFTFDIKGGKAEAKKLCDSLEIFSNLANVADLKSLIIHPSTTTHSQMDEKSLREVGITDATIRLSIGIEDVEDLINDLEKGFAVI